MVKCIELDAEIVKLRKSVTGAGLKREKEKKVVLVSAFGNLFDRGRS